MGTRDKIQFYLNGKTQSVGVEHAGMMLADYLRYAKGLVGTKIVCAEGDCGACTVLRRFPLAPRSAEWLPVNSCVTTVAQMDGSSIVSVDALAPSPGAHTPVQAAMMGCHGSQCGFCTPGFVMALTGLVEKKLCAKGPCAIDERDARNALTGNLCRCTGYQPILDAATAIDPKQCESVTERFWSRAQEKELKAALAKPVEIRGKEFTFFAPTKLATAAAWLKKNKAARLISGGTDLGVVHNKRKQRLAQLLSLHAIPELYRISKPRAGRIRVGSRVTLSELRQAVKPSVPELARFLDIFASPQIKNVATLAGNLANASPIGDTPPFLLVAGATVGVVGPRGKRTVKIEDFFKGYRKTALSQGELIAWIEFDALKGESLGLYKVSQRRDLDISTVNLAARVRWKKAKIDSVAIALGGVAATPLRFPKTEAILRGQSPDASLLARAAAVLQSEMQPLSDLRGTSAFRRVAAENLFQRFFRENTP